MAKELGVKFDFIDSKVVEGHEWYASNVLPHLRDGHAVMMSISGHIVRVQAVTEDGLVVDDPYGEATLLKGEGRKWDEYNKKGDSESNAGEDVVWGWTEVSKHTMRWIAYFDV